MSCLQDLGAECHTPSFAIQEASLQTLRAAADLQPRRNLPPMVPEFAFITEHPAHLPIPPLARPLSTPFGGRGASASAGVSANSNVATAFDHTERTLKRKTDTDEAVGIEEFKGKKIKIGIHWAPHEFVEKALEVGHPALSQSNFPIDMVEAVEFSLSQPPWKIAAHRTETVKRWLALANDLKPEEDKLREEMPERIRRVLQTKRLALFRKLLEQVQHPDDIVRDLCRGFDLTGRLPESNFFKTKFRPASLSEQSLRAHANSARKSVLLSTRSCGNPDVDEALFAATEKELLKGYLEGPVCLDQIPDGATLTKRFPVAQKNKVRPIDDYRSSLVNSAVTQPEGVSIHSIDHVAAMVTLWLKRLEDADRTMSLEAKCWDLEDAYKQIPLSQEAYKLDAFLCVYNPRTQQPQIFRQRVLPFGSVASVTAFLRCALGLWAIGSQSLKLVWSVYFDDFLSVVDSRTADHTDICVSLMFQILGWKVSAKKLVPYNTCCKVLGVELDLKETKMWQASIRNTDSRQAELVEEIEKILRKQTLRRHEGERLRGRLQFASCQVFGRRFNRCLKSLTKHVVSGQRNLSDETCQSLQMIADLLGANQPRRLNRRLAEYVHLYFDASFEPKGYSGLGGLILDSEGKCLGCFSLQVGDSVLRHLQKKGARTVIQELETLAILVGLDVWKDALRGRRAVIFSDSEAVRGSLLKGWSSNDNSDDLIEEIFKREEKLDCLLWFERVASQSNPSDYLSRQVVREWENVPCEVVDLERWFFCNVQVGVKRDLDSTPEQRKTCARSVAERVHVHDTCDSICRQK